MEQGKLNRRRRRKATERLNSRGTAPRLTTTESLSALNADCGSVKFHRILASRGLATPVEGFDGGYQFDLPSEYGGATYSIEHHSFQWTPAGINFICIILAEEGIAYEAPEELLKWCEADEM